MANQPSEVKLPTEVLRVAGNLNDGMAYERKLLLFIAASLSQNREVKDFAIVSNPKGIDKIDDVVVRVSFVDDGKEDIALFIQSKLTAPDKLLWLSLNNRKPTQKCYEIKLKEYQKAFDDVITMVNDNVSETEKLRELLKGVDEKDYFVCIYTNMEKVNPILQCKQFDEGHPIYFLTTRKCGEYRQFDYEKETFNNNFYRQLYIFLGQPNFLEIDCELTKILGKDFESVLVILDDTLKEFMQKGDMCSVLTKAEFEVQCLKVMLDKWLRVDLEQVIEINPKFIPVWCKILSHQTVINLGDNKIWPLFANYYQSVIRKEEDNQNVAELLFSLWRDNKIPLPIQSHYTQNLLGFLTKFTTISNCFIIFCDKDFPAPNYRSTKSVTTYVREISDNETLSEISNTEVSLQGRHPVPLSNIAGVPMETAIGGIYRDLTISQVLAWTENGKTHIIGPQLRTPDDKYITRNFTLKGEEQNKLKEEAVLELIGPRLHIITGEPGLGKSTVLEALAHSYAPQNFIVCIKLRDCLDDIENRSIWPSIQDDPIKYFFNKMTNNTDDEIAKSIMEIHKTSKRLCIFLDGFDEILPLHGRRISLLMETISNNTGIPIFCTTRPHPLHKITSRADTMFFELSPFDYKQIEEYFTKTNIDKEDIIWRFDFEFLGNPIHLDLISQIYLDKENRDGITRGEMYKRFIQLKHETYNKRRGFSQNDADIHNRTSMKNHRVLAMVDIFGKVCVTSKGLITDTGLADILKDICDQNIGIVDVRNSNKSFQFVHRTFAEYFVADFLLHTIVQDDSNTKYLKHFQKEVWFENDYIIIKNMMKELTGNFDLWLEVIQYFFINSDNESKSSTCTCDGFLGWLKCTASHRNVHGSTIVNVTNREYPTHRLLAVDQVDSCTNLLTAIHAGNEEDVESYSSQILLETGIGVIAFKLAIATGNERIVESLLTVRPTLVNEQDVNGNTGLHISCAFGFSSIAVLLFEHGASLDIVNKKGLTPLGMATENKQWGIWIMKHTREAFKISGEHGHYSPVYRKDISKAFLMASNDFKWNIVKKLLEDDPDLTIANNYGWTAMHFAARGRDLQVIDMLSERGCDVNKRTNSSKTPLTIACEEGESDIVKRLLEHGGDPTLSDENGWGPIHFAAKRGVLQIIAMVSEIEFNINAEAYDGKTPLAIACDAKNLDTIKWLLEHGADHTLSDNDGWAPIHFVSKRGELQIIDMLSERGINTNAQTNGGNTPLAIASDAKKSDIVKWLLEHGADPKVPDRFGWTPTHFATYRGDLEILEIFSERGLDVNVKTKDGKTPLAIAYDAMKSDTIKWLLEHGADPTLLGNNGWKPIHFAAERGYLQILEIFSERGLDINVKNTDGKTPLAVACDAMKSDTVKWFLDHGADPTLSDEADWTPTHFAAHRGAIQILKIFLERGLNISGKTKDGKTPLIIACIAQKSDTVKWLLEHGADPTLLDNAGWTPTHFAAHRGDLQILKIFSERRLNMNVKTTDGKTPLIIACIARKADTVKCLLEQSADPTLFDNAGWTPTHFAAHRGDLQILKMFSERWVNIDVKANDGKTPLVIACIAKKSDTVKWLLEKSADPTLLDNAGWTPTHFAAHRGDLQILKMFSERRLNIDVKTNDGKTPLAIACDANKSYTVKWLLEQGADPTVLDNAGWTPTHFAAHRGAIQILKIFSERRLNLHVKTKDGKTPFIIACIAQKSDTVECLLEQGADPTLFDNAGWTPTHFAAHRGDLQILKMFSERRLNLDVKTNDGKTPLAIACVANKSYTVKWLLEQGVDPTVLDNAGWTPTHFAAHGGDLQILKMFSERRLNLDVKTKDGKTPLIIACSAQKSDTVKWLLEHGANPTLLDNAGWTPTHFAAHRGDLQILEILFQRGHNMNAKTNDGKTALTIAADLMKLGTVKWLLQHGADPTLSDNAGWTPTHFAAKRGVLQILEVLTERGLNINAKTNDGKTAFSIARDEGHFKLLKLFLERSDTSISDKAGWSPMHFAAKRGDLKSLEMLTKRGLNINAKANDGKTPLIIACIAQKWDTVNWLLEHGADPSLSDNAGWSPMHFAAGQGQLEIIQTLSKEGFNVNEIANDGKTPLIIACETTKLNIVKWLLEHGADPTLSDNNGWTALHFAAKKPSSWVRNKLVIIKMLLARGLNVNVQNHQGQTPLAVARSQSWTAMVDLLLEHGSDGS